MMEKSQTNAREAGIQVLAGARQGKWAGPQISNQTDSDGSSLRVLLELATILILAL